MLKKILHSLTTTVKIFSGIASAIIIFMWHRINKYLRNVRHGLYSLIKAKMLSAQRVYKTFGFCSISNKSLRNVAIFFWLQKEIWIQTTGFLMSPTVKLHPYHSWLIFLCHKIRRPDSSLSPLTYFACHKHT